MTKSVSQNIADDELAVRVIRRSAASRGLIEIRFSCCDSQFTVFMNRSRFPSIPRYAFAAKSESPMAATRVSAFGGSSGLSAELDAGAGSGFSGDGAGTAVATAMET